MAATAEQGRVSQYVSRVREAVYSSLTEEYTPHEIAASFAVGTFITMLPTWGTGLLLFFVLVYLFDWINKVALFASVVVFNPVVKWGVYALSFALGFAILGPVEGVSLSDRPGFSDGWGIVIRLLVGNLILAVIATVAAYIAVYRIATAYHERQLPVLEQTVEQVVEGLEEHDPNLPPTEADDEGDSPETGSDTGEEFESNAETESDTNAEIESESETESDTNAETTSNKDSN